MNERSIQQRHKKREQVALGQPLLLVAATVRQLSRGRSDRSSNVVSTAAGVSKGYNACMSSAATSTTNSNWSNSNPTVEEITTANEEAFLSNQGTRMIPCLARRMSEDHNATVSKARSRSYYLLDTTL